MIGRSGDRVNKDLMRLSRFVPGCEAQSSQRTADLLHLHLFARSPDYPIILT